MVTCEAWPFTSTRVMCRPWAVTVSVSPWTVLIRNIRFGSPIPSGRIDRAASPCKVLVTLIDAEVSGGERGAIAKSLCNMVGGDKGAFERCRPVFATSGANIFHLGALGSGAITKLAHNLIVYVNVLAASEGMRLAEKAGVELDTMQQVVQAGAAQSRVADHWSQQRNMKDTYTGGPRGLLELIHKDLRLALELGHDLGLSLPGAALTQQLIHQMFAD